MGKLICFTSAHSTHDETVKLSETYENLGNNIGVDPKPQTPPPFGHLP